MEKSANLDYGFSTAPDFDNTPIFNAMSLTGLQGVDIVEFDEGEYFFKSPVRNFNFSNVTFKNKGSNRIKFTNNISHEIINLQSCNFINVSFFGINFSTGARTISSRVQDSSMLSFYTGSIDGLTFFDCGFTVPHVRANALKYYVPTGSSFKNINYRFSNFKDVGMMGSETVTNDAPNPPLIPRLQNFSVSNCTFERTGLFRNGMALSFSGRQQFIDVTDCTFINNPYCGIELIGVYDFKVDKNSFTGSGEPISCTGTSDLRKNDRGLITNNKAVDSEYGNVFINANNVSFFNNYWDSNARWYFDKTNNFTFLNDEIYILGFSPNTNNVSSCMQFSGNVNNNFKFEKCIIGNKNNQILFSGSPTDISILDSKIDVQNEGNYLGAYAIRNVERWVGGTLKNIYKEDGNLSVYGNLEVGNIPVEPLPGIPPNDPEIYTYGNLTNIILGL